MHILLFGILIVKNLFSLDFHDFDPYQGKLTAEEVEIKIKTFLEKDQSISCFYQLTPEVLYIGDLAHQQIDYALHLNNTSQMVFKKSIANYNKATSDNSLKNIKIAIDPGHFGGDLAELEGGNVKIPAEKTDKNQPISFNEGTLTYLTAIALKSLLEAEGAIVFITRPDIGRGAIKESFPKWLEKHPLLLKSGDSLSKIFRKYYNQEDLIARARDINAFAPDITIIIHYNSHLTDLEKKHKALLTKSNFNLVFIPGAFCLNELNKIEDRYEFLRLIVTDDIEQSLKLSQQIIFEFVDKLNVPVISDNEKTSYIDKTCFIQPGIYSRNLVLTRLVHSPLCYGETLVQNNENEIYRLSCSDIQEGQAYPKRINEVAQAYFAGIKNYFKLKRSCKKEN